MSDQQVINKLYWSAGITIILIIVPYLCIFGDGTFSLSKAEWGAFGDYFGGIINPIIGIANLYFLIRLTFIVDRLEDQRRTNDLNNQKYLTLYTIRHEAIKTISSILEKVQLEIIEGSEKSNLKLILIRNEIHSFINANDYLFPSLKEKIHRPLAETIMEFSDLTKRYYEAVIVNNNFELGEEINDGEIIPLMESFNEMKVNFLQRLQQDIINGNDHIGDLTVRE